MSKQRASIPKGPTHPVEGSGSRLAAARPGDWRAELDALYRENEDPVWAMLVAARVRNPDEALQDVFLELAEKMNGGEVIASPKGLLGTILWRRIGRERRSFSRDPHVDVDMDKLPEQRPNPEEALALGRQKKTLGEALDALPKEARKLVEELELDGKSPAEVATSMGIRPGTLRMKGSRARTLLRDLFLRLYGKDRGD